jgi:hypothetical protein
MSLRIWPGILAGMTLAQLPAFGVDSVAAPIPVEWQSPVEVANGRGQRGPWQQNHSRYDFVDDPSVALSEGGEMAVAWVDQAKKEVFFQRFSPDGRELSAPVNVSRSPGTFSWLPRLATVPGAPGELLVAWQEIIFSGGSHGGEILLAVSHDSGRAFSAPVNLSRSVGGDGKGRINKDVWHNGSFDLVAGRRGDIYVTWTEYDGPLWFTRSSDGGKSFSRPARIAGDTDSPARAPSLALGPDGAVYLAWTVGEDNSADIHVSRSLDGGQSFSPSTRPTPSPNYSDAPKLAVDSGGVLHLVYAESSGGPWAEYHVRHTSSTDAGRSFAPSRSISARRPDGTRSMAFPAVAVDGRGRLYVLSELYGDARRPPRGLALSISQDGGKSFSEPSLVPASADPSGGINGSSQGLLMKKLAVNRSGTVAVVNSSLKPDSHSRVWLMRGAARTR